MIVSHSKRFVMFLPWKTASGTLAARLAPYDEGPYNTHFRFNARLNRVIHRHVTCADFLGLPEAGLGYFRASFVRNPYDRMYSGFRQIQADLRAAPHVAIEQAWVKALVHQQLMENHQLLQSANHDFDQWVALIQEHQVLQQGRNSNLPLHPACYWTHVADHQFVDFIGRVERFEEDLGIFADLVDVVPLRVASVNVAERAERSGVSAEGYRYVARMNDASIRKINHLFAADFERLGYRKIKP